MSSLRPQRHGDAAAVSVRTFCGYCGHPVEDDRARGSRVCPRCSLGLLITAPADVAPQPDDAFLVVDELVRIRAVSRTAERLLRSSEQALVGRQVGEVLTSAEVAPTTGVTLSALIAHAVRDETSRASAAVRP